MFFLGQIDYNKEKKSNDKSSFLISVWIEFLEAKFGDNPLQGTRRIIWIILTRGGMYLFIEHLLIILL